MLDILRTPEAPIVIVVWAVAMMAIIGFYVVRRYRDQTADDTPGANELLTNFREMHLEGDIEEAEYRKIKTQMSDQLKEELNRPDETD